jgi:hypothetical protein
MPTGKKVSFETNSTAAKGIYNDAAGDILARASLFSPQIDALTGTSAAG